jgi:hypothetical protein
MTVVAYGQVSARGTERGREREGSTIERSLFASCRATGMYSSGNFISLSFCDMSVFGTAAWYFEIYFE